MNTSYLKIISDVAIERSFSSAGRKNKVSQSAATQAVHRLEKRYGREIVDRSARPIKLTPFGMSIINDVHKVVSLLDGIDEKAKTSRAILS